LWEYRELDETFSFTIYNLQISLLKFIEGNIIWLASIPRIVKKYDSCILTCSFIGYIRYAKVMVSQLVVYSLHVTPLIAIWVALLYDWLPYTRNFTRKYYEFILYLPIYAIFLLGIYAMCNVLYGVATFNDCHQAREELKKEIEDAKADLKRRNVIP
uniref:Dolichol-phosphate mannosyltransferase subunit 3 n=1 Tax=Brugia pahangi TaxID=6280 RepID=A0A0N4TNG6_BRUPA